MKLAQAQSVFLHGISGTGMRGLAWVLHKQGKRILGADTALADDLPDVFEVTSETEAGNLLDHVDLYIYSDAIPANHELRVLAESKSISQMPYHEALGSLTQGCTTIAVAGTHGKSSTTAFLAHIAIEAGLDPTVVIGASMSGWEGKHARFGKSGLYIVEADEYRNHFRSLAPTYEVVTSIDFDHPDFFPDVAAVIQSFQGFIDRLIPDGSLVFPSTLQYRGQLSLPSDAIMVAAAKEAPLPGEHMKYNFALAVKVAELLGISPDKAVQLGASFSGLQRRFETLGLAKESPVISDYGHHPAEIKATIAAARDVHPSKNIVVIFEAHMEERLKAFLPDFIDSLAAADALILYPPFFPTGRSTDTSDYQQQLVNGLESKAKEPITVQNATELASEIEKMTTPNTVFLGFSAGNLDQDLRKIVNYN